LLPVAFKPVVAGFRTSELFITSNSNNVPGTVTKVSLSGTGVEARLTIARNPIRFGSPGSQTITLTSSGSTSVQVGSWSLSGPDAAAFNLGDPVCSSGGLLVPGEYLEPGTVCAMSLTFKPIHRNLHTATLVIEDSTGVHTVPITSYRL
jgi:hypothetical protein